MSPKRIEVEQILASLSNTNHCLIGKDCLEIVTSRHLTKTFFDGKLYNTAAWVC